MAKMRRIQIVMESELDDWLEREARARGLSKSALVRDVCAAGAGAGLGPCGERPRSDRPVGSGKAAVSREHDRELDRAFAE